jgi:hypothetical protein
MVVPSVFFATGGGRGRIGQAISPTQPIIPVLPTTQPALPQLTAVYCTRSWTTAPPSIFCRAPARSVRSGRPEEGQVQSRYKARIVLELFEECNDIPTRRLVARSRTRLDRWFRCMFSTSAVCRLGFRVGAVTQVLIKTPGSMSRGIGEGHELQLSDGAFRARRAEICREIEIRPQPEQMWGRSKIRLCETCDGWHPSPPPHPP